MDTLQSCTLNYLRELGCTFRAAPEGNLFTFSVQGRRGIYPVLLYAREPYLVCLAKLPDAIPDESRLEVAEYLHRANYGLLLGSLEMDYDRGEVRYRTALLTEGACPAEGVLDRYIQMPAAMLDRYAAGIEAIVLEGEIAQEALARVEED